MHALLCVMLRLFIFAVFPQLFLLQFMLVCGSFITGGKCVVVVKGLDDFAHCACQ